MNTEELAGALSESYERGAADERARHTLEEFDTVPDLDGWYWFDGEQAGEWPHEWYRTQTIAECTSGKTYVAQYHDELSCEVTLRGKFIGPIPNPFKEEQP